jgi:hypothetical protein
MLLEACICVAETDASNVSTAQVAAIKLLQWNVTEKLSQGINDTAK